MGGAAAAPRDADGLRPDGTGKQERGRGKDPRPQPGSAAPHGPQPMFTMMVFLWVKCSSIASSEASLPRPEDFTPP